MAKNKRGKTGFSAIVVLAMTAALPVFTSGCSADDSIVEIRETMFLTQVQHIYMNANDFLGRTIKLEGIFTAHEWENSNYYFVIRFGPDGCCGMDGRVGFEVRWPEGRTGNIPPNNSWVEAVGVLSYLVEHNNPFLYLQLTSLNALNRRGREVVFR